METNKTISKASEIFRNRYIKGNKKRLKRIEHEHERIETAKKIYELRTRANLSQKEFAKKVGTRQSVISRLENADYSGHSQKMLQKIAEAFNCRLRIDFVPNDSHCLI